MFVDSNLFCVSLTVNICCLSYCLCGRIVDFLGTKYGDKNGFVTLLFELHIRKPWRLGKIITEILVICLLAVLAVTSLSTTSVSVLPFSGNETVPVDSLVETVMSINIGRYVYMIIQGCFLHHHLTHFKTDMIHHLVTTGAYIVFLAYKQNMFLSVAGLLLELNLIPIEIGRLVREVDKHSHHCRRFAIASCTATMVSRGVIPIVFLAIALSEESPFDMKIAPLTIFFLCIVFFFIINFCMILQTISRVVKYSPCGPGEVNENIQNYVTVKNPMEPQSRDVILPGGQIGTQSVTFSSLNYGYLKSYDNRNVCNNENDKVNYSTKKVSKPNLLCNIPKVLSPPDRRESKDVSSNATEVFHNSFPRTRVHFQDEVASSSPLFPENIDIKELSANRDSIRRLSTTGSTC